MLMRLLPLMLLLAPEGDGSGGGAGKEEGGKPAAGGGNDPGPVPYSVFADTNKQLRESQARTAELQKAIDGFKEWKSPKDVEAIIAGVKEENQRELMFTEAQVDPRYRDYMKARFDAEKPKDIKARLEELKTQEPAFFATTSNGAGGGQAEKPPPKTNPNGGANGAKVQAPGGQKPLTPEEIAQMTPEQYAANRKAILENLAAQRRG